MRSTLLFGVALFTLLLSGCESEAEDAIVVDLLAIEYANPGNSETACRVSYVVRNNTQNRLNRLWLTLSWSEESEANENKSNAQIAVKDVPPKGKWKTKNQLPLTIEGQTCANVPDPWVAAWNECRLENTPEGDCQNLVRIKKSY
tara:strand:+ start:213 stop:647 length:435 start_codon:yes stop_codon:yes gene_type:complete